MDRIAHRTRHGWWLLLLLLASACDRCNGAKPLLWRIEAQQPGGKPSYLFGTIHYPDDRVLKLPGAVTDAIDEADTVVTEVPMDSATQMQMAMKSMLPGGKTLQDVLPEDLYARLSKLFEAKGLPMMAIKRFKIWAVAVQVALVDHLMELASKTPLDMHLYNLGKERGKELGGLETIEEQLAVFDSLTQEEQVEMLRQALEEREKNLEKGKDLLEMMVKMYLAGNADLLMERMMEEYDPENPLDSKLIKKLFTDRNHVMAERIAARIRETPGKSCFFAIGTGHLPGDDGVLALLQKAGFGVTRVD